MKIPNILIIFTVLSLGLVGCGGDTNTDSTPNIIAKNTVTIDTSGLPNSFSIKLVADNVGSGTYDYAALGISDPSGATVYAVTLTNRGTVTSTCTLQSQDVNNNYYNCLPQSTTTPAVGGLPQTLNLGRGWTYSVKIDEFPPVTRSTIGSFTIN